MGRTYSCWMLNCWCITWPVGFKRLKEVPIACDGCRRKGLIFLRDQWQSFKLYDSVSNRGWQQNTATSRLGLNSEWLYIYIYTRVWAEIIGIISGWISNNDRVPAQKRNIEAGCQTVQICRETPDLDEQISYRTSRGIICAWKRHPVHLHGIMQTDGYSWSNDRQRGEAYNSTPWLFHSKIYKTPPRGPTRIRTICMLVTPTTLVTSPLNLFPRHRRDDLQFMCS